MHPTPEPVSIVIIGASGDLTRRKLVPALHSLACQGLLHPATRIIGIARSPYSQDRFRDRLREGVQSYARLRAGMCESWSQTSDRVFYLSGSYDDPATYHALAQMLAGLESGSSAQSNRLFHLAVPPLLYPAIVQHLGQAQLHHSATGWTRAIIEKPFGRDLASAQALNAQLHSVFDESQVYRIDHYLGKETVQNALVFRFGNSVFEPLWNRNYVDHVQITMAESIGVEHRAGYYDHTGVLRDMFQNHMLQLLSLTAMEPPFSLDEKPLRDEKVKVLQAVRAILPADGVWGQYEGYPGEPEVSNGSRTPTYFAGKLYVDNWRWQGVPFYLRSGKRLARKTTSISLHFKPIPHRLLPEQRDLPANTLSLSIQPNEGINLRIDIKMPGAGMRSTLVDMAFRYGEHFGDYALPDAYERLLLDAMQGDGSLFARSDEIETAWRLIDPLALDVEPDRYTPGSQGPAAADAFMARDGRAWSPLA